MPIAKHHSPGKKWFQIGLLDLGIILVLQGVVVSGTIQVFETLPTKGPSPRPQNGMVVGAQPVVDASQTAIRRDASNRFVVRSWPFTREWFAGLLTTLFLAFVAILLSHIGAAWLSQAGTEATRQIARRAGASAGCVIFLTILLTWAYTTYSQSDTNSELKNET